MLDVLTGFIGELRAAGLPVSLTESIDAAEAVHHIPLEDRDALKYALAATLVKTSSHWKAFETAFEVYFSMRGPQYEFGDESSSPDSDTDSDTDSEDRGQGQGRGQGGGGGEALSSEELAEMLFRALLSANDAQVAALARQAVSRFAGMEPGRPVGGTYYLYRTLRNLDLDRVLERLMETARAAAPEGQLTPLEERLARDEFKSRLDGLRRELEDEIRRRLVADRGTEALARSLRKPLPEEIDFMHATRDELASLRRAIHPLTRKLAVRLARKRRHGRKGPLDFRSTMRHSLSTGGVPVDPKFRYPRPAKPEIIVIADISGSVASFAAVHPPSRPRHQLAILEGAQLRVHRRHRRGHEVLRERRRCRRCRAPHQHRGRCGVGRRPLRLRPRPVGVLGTLGRGDHAALERAPARATPATTTTPRRPGSSRRSGTAPATCTGSIPSPVPTGGPVTPSWASTPCTATPCSSAGTCASSSIS